MDRQVKFSAFTPNLLSLLPTNAAKSCLLAGEGRAMAKMERGTNSLVTVQRRKLRLRSSLGCLTTTTQAKILTCELDFQFLHFP